MTAKDAKITCHELSAARWPDVELLFGKNGACGGCWCMSWRVEKGESWDDLKGASAKRRLKGLIEEGKAHGALAYLGGQPVGWCSFGPRRDYARLDRAPSFKVADADQVWSIPCFFVHKDYRGQGVSRALLDFAERAMHRRGAKLIEGYPVKTKSDQKLPAAFAWTGTGSLFADAGFAVAGNRGGGKQRVRKATGLR